MVHVCSDTPKPQTNPTFLKRTTPSADTSYLANTASSEVRPNGTSSTASPDFRKALAPSDSTSCGERGRRLAQKNPVLHVVGGTRKGKESRSPPSVFKVGYRLTLKKPMTATSLSAIMASAWVTSVMVVAAGPVRFFSQLTMSSACLPAAADIDSH